jgi:integrase
MTRKTDYLFQPRNSRMWHIRLQGEHRIERSLGTPDRAQADILALPLIAQHKAALLAKRPHVTTSWWHEYEPGREHIAPDGSRIIATDTTLIYINPDGSTRTVPNGAPQYIMPTRSTTPSFERLDEALERAVPPPAKSDDDALIEAYIEHSGLTGNTERQARNTWAVWRALCPTVKLADATRDDGRKLVAHFKDRGDKTATIRRKLVPLRAAVNLAIREGKLQSINPFADIVAKPKIPDSERRLPFSDDDMKVIRASLDKLTAADKLMVTMLATTGMRVGECFHIDGEQVERGVRFVMVGTKTEASLRRVPLPAKVLPLLPKAIKGKLFEGNARAASVRLGRWLRATGIEDSAKVLHSFRHRAQDRLRAAECPSDVRHALLGHDDRSVAESYGAGFAVTVLKKWIDRIGI